MRDSKRRRTAMAVTLTQTFGAVTPEGITQFEKKYGIDLPADYRNFLLRCNGGSPQPESFHVPDWHGGETAVNFFYGIHDGKHYNLGKSFENTRTILAPGFMAIGCDPGGDLILLGFKGEHRGQVYFWDHEDALDEEGHSKMDMSNMY